VLSLDRGRLVSQCVHCQSPSLRIYSVPRGLCNDRVLTTTTTTTTTTTHPVALFRIGTAEVESALVAHPKCAEAAVVGYEHPIKGQGIYAYVTLMEGIEPTEDIRRELIQTVRGIIGAFAAPDVIHWVSGARGRGQRGRMTGLAVDRRRGWYQTVGSSGVPGTTCPVYAPVIWASTKGSMLWHKSWLVGACSVVAYC